MNLTDDLDALLTYLATRGRQWTTSNQIGSALGPRFTRRHIADLRELSAGAILSSRGSSTHPPGYLLISAATKTDFDHYLAERLADRKAITHQISSTIRRWKSRSWPPAPAPADRDQFLLPLSR